MSQRSLIVNELKRALRERSVTYAKVAAKLRLTEASVKRLFSTADFSLQRLDDICELLDMQLSDLIERMHERDPTSNQLTIAQEQEVISDPKLFLITWLVLNRWQFEDIVAQYQFTEREALRYLIKLDRLKVVELQPRNRIRLLVSRHFAWRANGPVQNYIHQKLLKEFLATRFQDSREEFFFHGGVISDLALTQLKRALQNASRECVEIMDRDRALPMPKRSGAAFVLAMRPWEYSGFSHFARDSLRRN